MRARMVTKIIISVLQGLCVLVILIACTSKDDNSTTDKMSVQERYLHSIDKQCRYENQIRIGQISHLSKKLDIQTLSESDIETLEKYLKPVIPEPPTTKNGYLPEGYAQRHAALLLSQLGSKVKEDLYELFQDNDRRKYAFIALAEQGDTEAIFRCLEYPEDRALLLEMAQYIEAHDTPDLETTGDPSTWMIQNKEALTIHYNKHARMYIVYVETDRETSKKHQNY